MLNAVIPTPGEIWKMRQTLCDVQWVADIHYIYVQDDEHTCRHCVAYAGYHLAVAEQLDEATRLLRL